MWDYAYSGRFNFEQISDLTGGELRDRDDQLRTLGGNAGLFGESLAELGRRVVTTQDEQIVEGGYGAAMAGGIDALVQTMKEVD